MENGMRIIPAYYGQHDTALETKGCYSFSVANKGTVKAYLWDIVELEPGQQEPFHNINGWPYGENVKLAFAKGEGEKRILLTMAVKIEAPCGE